MKQSPEILAIILARGGSKSIPRKNVLPLHGKPLVAWPVDLAKSVSRISRVVMTTDDEEIASIARKHGAEVPFMRPPELADDQTPTLPVIHHCLTALKEAEGYIPDIVLILYPTAPFLRASRVEEALDLFATGCNSVVSVVKDWGRFWRYDADLDKYRVLHPLERVNRQYYQPSYREDGAVYFSRYEVLMEQNKLVDDTNVGFLIMEENENIDIDLPSDMAKAQAKKPL